MKKLNRKSNKKLALFVGAALSFGMAFGTMPYDAAEAATVDITGNGSNYDIVIDNGEKKTVTYTQLVDEDGDFMKSLQDGGNKVTIHGSKTATALSGNGLNLGKDTVVEVVGSTNNASIATGDSPSGKLSIDGSSIKGDNVNLKSVDVSVKNGQTAKIDVSGKIESVSVTADNTTNAGNGNVSFGGNVAVSDLSVAEGAVLSVVKDATVTADKLTVANGATIAATSGTVKADTLTLSEGAKVESGASVAVKEIVVDASSATAAADLAKTIESMKVSSVDGGTVTVTVDTSKMSNADQSEINKVVESIKNAANTAASNGGATATVGKAISVSKGTDGKFAVNGTAVEGSKLADAVSGAYTNGTTKVTLDKDAAQAISNSGNAITVPANSTLTVTDSSDGATVSATPAESAALTITGNQISAPAGTHFKDVTVDAKGVKVDNTIKDAVIENVTVKNGILSTENATVTNLTVENGDVTTADKTNGTIKATNAVINGGTVTAPKLEAESATFNGGTINADVTADKVTVTGTATVGAGKTISAAELVVDDVKKLGGLTVAAKDGGALIISKADGSAFTDDELKDIAASVSDGTVVKNDKGETITTGTNKGDDDNKGDNGKDDDKDDDTAAVEAAEKAKTEAETARQEALEKVGGEYAAMDEDAIAEIKSANPFSTSSTKLPSASEIAAMSNASDDTVKALSDAKDKLMAAAANYTALAAKETDATKQAEYNKLATELKNQASSLLTSTTALKEQAAKLTAAAQYAGKTAAAPGATSGRTASVIASVMTNNVTARNNELRGMAAAIDDGREESENMWVQFKHTDMDVDNGGTYGKSNVNTNNIQLGYDAKVGPEDYVGVYVGTTTGSADFSGPAANGSVDLDNAFDLGFYGTHMLPAGQYLDYMLHTGSFDSKYAGEKWGTTDTGLMLGYGTKIEQNDRLTVNPYVQLAYDHVKVGSYKAGNNQIASDASDNWTAKLGVNLIDASGFYGGLAYSRGLSGSYNAYINGVPMPSNDNNANVVYLNLGYRANVARNTLLDLSMEKTFVDYDGWTAAGKVNFFF